MKKIVSLLSFLGFVIICRGQVDTSLVNRLNRTLQFTKLMNFNQILDYTYPKLFTIVTREQMLDALKNSFETDEFTTELDSLELDTIFPVFKINDGNYAKIKHTMLMKMKYKEPFDTSDKEGTKMLVSMMAGKFGEGNVRFVQRTNSLHIFIHADMVAIKDKLSPQWTFVNFDEDNPAMLNLLFSKEVLDKLKGFK